MNRFLVVIMLLVVFLAGCATLSGTSLSRLNLGMLKDAVIKLIGAPTFVTAVQEPNGSAYELWEYVTETQKKTTQTTWFAFQDKSLVAWGRASDFKNYSPQVILEHRFVATPISVSTTPAENARIPMSEKKESLNNLTP